MPNQKGQIVLYLFLLCKNAIIFMLMSDIPTQSEANGGLSEFLEVDFCVGTYLGG